MKLLFTLVLIIAVLSVEARHGRKGRKKTRHHGQRRIQCQEGVKLFRCTSNPCRFDRCAKHPEATCKPDYCGGCKSKFYIDDQQVNCDGDTEEAKHGHPSKPCSRSFNCLANPCLGKKCKNHPEALCRPNYCQGCNADFYLGGEKVECEDDMEAVIRNECPNGAPLMKCFANPCQMATCEAYPEAKCVPNYCGGCSADFYEGKEKVNCKKRAVIGNECPTGAPMVKCFANPCQMATCEAYPEAKCVPNYCGGCNADFYEGKEKVNCKKQELVPSFYTCHRCHVNPCNMPKCRRRGHQYFFRPRCVRDHCNGCKAKFMIGHQTVGTMSCL